MAQTLWILLRDRDRDVQRLRRLEQDRAARIRPPPAPCIAGNSRSCISTRRRMDFCGSSSIANSRPGGRHTATGFSWNENPGGSSSSGQDSLTLSDASLAAPCPSRWQAALSLWHFCQSLRVTAAEDCFVAEIFRTAMKHQMCSVVCNRTDQPANARRSTVQIPPER